MAGSVRERALRCRGRRTLAAVACALCLFAALAPAAFAGNGTAGGQYKLQVPATSGHGPRGGARIGDTGSSGDLLAILVGAAVVAGGCAAGYAWYRHRSGAATT